MRRVVVIETDWIPPASLRGNALASHRTRRYSDKKALRESGLAHGLEFRQSNPDVGCPLTGRLRLTIDARVSRRIDGDNLLVSYKPLIDGLCDADIIRDDADIWEWTIRVDVGTPVRSLITLQAPCECTEADR